MQNRMREELELQAAQAELRLNLIVDQVRNSEYTCISRQNKDSSVAGE